MTFYFRLHHLKSPHHHALHSSLQLLFSTKKKSVLSSHLIHYFLEYKYSKFAHVYVLSLFFCSLVHRSICELYKETHAHRCAYTPHNHTAAHIKRS